MGNFYKREDPDPEDWTPTHSDHKTRICRGCSKILAHGDRFSYFNGWPWCYEPCYRRIVALSMDPDQRELEGQEQAARQDIERDDFNIVRR